MKSKLSAADNQLIRKATKMLDKFHDLDDMANNALTMSVLISDLLKLINKKLRSDNGQQEENEKLTKEINELKAENKILKDGGGRLINELKKIERKKRTKKYQHWVNNHHPDMLN